LNARSASSSVSSASALRAASTKRLYWAGSSGFGAGFFIMRARYHDLVDLPNFRGVYGPHATKALWVLRGHTEWPQVPQLEGADGKTTNHPSQCRVEIHRRHSRSHTSGTAPWSLIEPLRRQPEQAAQGQTQLATPPPGSCYFSSFFPSLSCRSIHSSKVSDRGKF